MKTKIQFDIFHSGKDYRQVDLVDKDGNPVDVYPSSDGKDIFIIGGTAYSLDEANNGMLFEEIDDERIDVYKTDVTDYAKEFQSMEDDYVKKKIIECANWFFEVAGIFGHYAFFSQKMWKKVPGFERADEGEIIAVFLHWWFRYKYGFQNMPCGSAWSSNVPSVYNENDELFNDYINKYQPVLKAYSDWFVNQR